jgi:predicted dehydrogenase
MKVGVIGCGYWGPNLLRNLFTTGRCREIFCFDASPATMQKALGRHPYMHPATSVNEILAVCDAVMIATPVKSHYSLARAALQNGCGVFVEKPLTASYVEAVELIRMAKRERLPLMTGHTFLYSPAVRKIRSYIDSGTIGGMHWLRSERVNLGIHRQDVNVIWDLAPHDLSMFLYWLQESPMRVSAVGRRCLGSNMDVATLNLEFASGAVASVLVSWLAPIKLRQTVIIGTEKTVVYDDTSTNEKIKLHDTGAKIEETPASFGEYQLSYRTGDLLSPRLESTEPLLAQTEAFLNWVEHGIEPENNTWIALQVIACIEAACRSAQENGRMVDVAGTSRPRSFDLPMPSREPSAGD